MDSCSQPSSTQDEDSPNTLDLYIDPEKIFFDDDPEGMTGPNNIALAISFLKARYIDVKYLENIIKYGLPEDEYKPNAGAIQLYKANRQTVYPGFENLEFNCLSERINKFTTYGHSERLLLRQVLVFLMSAEDAEIVVDGEILEPLVDLHIPGETEEDQKKYLQELKENASEYKKYLDSHYSGEGLEEKETYLKRLTVNGSKYKKYLERKEIIVKMWSEREACSEGLDYCDGGYCEDFLKNILPKGSILGHIVEHYQVGRTEETEEASRAFVQAYLKYRG